MDTKLMVGNDINARAAITNNKGNTSTKRAIRP